MSLAEVISKKYYDGPGGVCSPPEFQLPLVDNLMLSAIPNKMYQGSIDRRYYVVENDMWLSLLSGNASSPFFHAILKADSIRRTVAWLNHQVEASVAGTYMISGNTGGVILDSPTKDVQLYIKHNPNRPPIGERVFKDMYIYVINSFFGQNSKMNCYPLVLNHAQITKLLKAMNYTNAIKPFMEREKLRMEIVVNTGFNPPPINTKLRLALQDKLCLHSYRCDFLGDVMCKVTRKQVGWFQFCEKAKASAASYDPEAFESENSFWFFLMFFNNN